MASLHTGIYAQPSLLGEEVFYIQARHFDRNRQLLKDTQPELRMHQKLQKHFLEPGDVLVAAKGYEHFAVPYTGKEGQAVASSIFIIIRLRSGEVRPDYLAWYINHPETQKLLSCSRKGTALPAITKQAIGDIVVPVPSLKKQQLIVRIDELQKREQALIQQINELKQKQLQQNLFELI